MQNFIVNIICIDEKKNMLFDVVKSFIFFFNLKLFLNVDYILIIGNFIFVKLEDDVQREWEFICLEIEKDVGDYQRGFCKNNDFEVCLSLQ